MNRDNEYAIGLLDVKWSVGRVLLLIMLALLSFFVRKYVSTNPYMPFWLDEFSAFLAAAIDGPVFGAAVAALWLLIDIAVNSFSIHTFLIIMMYAIVSAMFGAMFRLGFFGSRKTAPTAFIILVAANTLAAVSTGMAVYGESTFTNLITTTMHNMLTSVGVHGLVSSLVSYATANIVDKLIVIPGVILIIKFTPDKIANFFSINKTVPVAVFVNDAEEGEFQDEKDRLKQNAQEKIERKKSAEAIK